MGNEREVLGTIARMIKAVDGERHNAVGVVLYTSVRSSQVASAEKVQLTASNSLSGRRSPPRRLGVARLDGAG